jgi:hypothetical protein
MLNSTHEYVLSVDSCTSRKHYTCEQLYANLYTRILYLPSVELHLKTSSCRMSGISGMLSVR